MLPMDATAVLLLPQAPPAVASVWVMLWPAQTVAGPPIAAGVWFTVTVSVAVQPPGSVYIMAVVPGMMPVTRPVVELMVAVPVELLLQEPMPVPSLWVMVCPVHTDTGPVMAPGDAHMVTVVMAWQPPLNE